MVDEVELTEAVTPKESPVSAPEPLTGKERAGVTLTWGIITVLGLFLIIILSIFVWGDYRFLSGMDKLEQLSDTSPAALNELTRLTTVLESRHKSFRAFWFDTLQLIVLNVLFPTLTALLGYVFGTSRNNNSSNGDQS